MATLTPRVATLTPRVLLGFCYYLTDLPTGRGFDVLNVFGVAMPRPKTQDGYEYGTRLISYPHSRLLVVQYNVALAPRQEECRERMFVFDGAKLTPSTNTRIGCGSY